MLTILFLIFVVLSFFKEVEYTRFGVYRGRLVVITEPTKNWPSPTPYMMWLFLPAPPHFFAMPTFIPRKSGLIVFPARVVIPLGLPLVVVLPLTSTLFWRRLPYPSDHCQSCGYNLQGNTSGTCPECGKAVKLGK
jgi:hypothetical protein